MSAPVLTHLAVPLPTARRRWRRPRLLAALVSGPLLRDMMIARLHGRLTSLGWNLARITIETIISDLRAETHPIRESHWRIQHNHEFLAR